MSDAAVDMLEPAWSPSLAVEPRPGVDVRLESEVLSAVLVDGALLENIRELLTVEDFTAERHQLILSSMLAISDASLKVEVVALQSEMQRAGSFERAGGAMALAKLLDRAGATSNHRSYCVDLADLAIIRAHYRAGAEIQDLACRAVSAEELTSSARAELDAVASKTSTGRIDSMADAVRMSSDDSEAAALAEGSVLGLSTGFASLDALGFGLGVGDLIIIAGRPAMGKTALAGTIADTLCNAGHRGAFATLEMTTSQLASRSLARTARVDLGRLMLGQMTQEEWPRYTRALDVVGAWPMSVIHEPGINVHRLRTICHRMHRVRPLRFLIVDYIQLMGGASKRRGATRDEEVSETTRRLKSLAGELSATVIALSQLNRGVESRTNKRPIMSDLRESGAIEQDADKILFPFRPEVYGQVDAGQRGLAELIIAKHRNGAVGTALARFEKTQTLFTEWSSYGGHDPLYGGQS